MPSCASLRALVRPCALHDCALLRVPAGSRALQRFLQSTGFDENVTRQQLQAEVDSVLDITTPYGKLVETMHLDSVEEGPATQVPLHYANPFALVWHLCILIPRFAHFLNRCYEQAAKKLRKTALYTDEATPGNQLRPDNSRQVQNIYWTFLFFPHWFRRRKHGWWPVAIMKTVHQHRVLGDLSCVVKHVLRLFFSPDGFNLSVGMRIPLRVYGRQEDTIIQVENGPMIQDLKAHQHTNDTKGPAGTKCCLKCKAVVSTVPQRLGADPYVVHFALARRDQWDPHDPQAYSQMADILTNLHSEVVQGRLTKGSFNLVQQMFGLHYRPNGLLWDPYLRKHYDPVKQSYEDWLHCLYTSGGIGPYEINGFSLAVKDLFKTLPQLKGKCALEILDEFHEHIHWANGERRLCRDFFQTRIQDKGECAKCFAVEAMAAIKVLSAFCTAVLVPSGHLPRHCQSMRLLSEIGCLLEGGDMVLSHTDVLRTKIAEHRTLYVGIYTLALAKPKLHALEHVPDNMDEHGANLDCRPMEWKHSTVKKMHQNLFAPGASELSCLKRMLVEMFEDLAETEFCPNCLIMPRPAPELRPFLLLLMPDVGHEVKASRLMHTAAGRISVGSVVQLRTSGSNKVVCRTKLFGSGRPVSGGEPRCFVVFEEHVQTSLTQWMPNNELSITPAEDVLQVLPYMEVGGCLQPLFPEHDLQ